MTLYFFYLFLPRLKITYSLTTRNQYMKMFGFFPPYVLALFHHVVMISWERTEKLRDPFFDTCENYSWLYIASLSSSKTTNSLEQSHRLERERACIFQKLFFIWDYILLKNYHCGKYRKNWKENLLLLTSASIWWWNIHTLIER